jgi:hypothetical protein
MDEFSYSRNCCSVRKTVRGPCILPQQILCRTDGSFDYAIRVHGGKNARGTRVFPSDSLGRPRRRWPLSISIAEGLDVIRQQFCKFVAAGQRQPATLHIKEVLSGLIGECYLGPLPRFIGMTVALLNFLAEFLEHDAPPRVTGGSATGLSAIGA